MGLQLSSDVRHVIADGRHIFLDIERDRYFGVSERTERALERNRAGVPLLDDDRAALLPLIAAGLPGKDPTAGSQGPEIPAARRSVLDDDAGPAPYWRVGGAVFHILVAKRLHRTAPLAHILRRVDRIPIQRKQPFDEAKLREHARAFHKAALVTSTHDQCVPCSLALTVCLRRDAIPARLVMGVSGRPFAAHCWVQVGDRVVNDTLDHVILFTPILIR